MIGRLVLAVVVAIVVGLLCLLFGAIFDALGVPIAVTIGAFLIKWGWILGVLAGIWFFFSGRTSLAP